MLLKTGDRTRIRLDFEEWLERQPKRLQRTIIARF
jgi:hypothetical protein